MSTEPDLSHILRDLAAGRIDATEAARRIDRAKQAAADEDPPAGGDAPPPASPDTPPTAPRAQSKGKGAERVSIRSVGRRVRVVGDPAVIAVSVEGPHVLRRNAGVIEVSSDGELGPSLREFNLLKPPRSLDDLRTIGLGREIVVRVNPALTVDAEVTASGLHCEGVPSLGRIRVTAGGATLKDVVQVADALVQAGSAVVEGPLSQGRSRIKCESGGLSITLTEGANVTVRGRAQVGRINWPDESASVDEFTVGNGSARLDIDIVMGIATLKDES